MNWAFLTKGRNGDHQKDTKKKKNLKLARQMWYNNLGSEILQKPNGKSYSGLTKGAEKWNNSANLIQ